MIHVCVPVLRRYDLLQQMLVSLNASTRKDVKVYVIDNGRNADRVDRAALASDFHVKVHRPKQPMGVAESWNWFLDNVPEERLIVNDDIVFAQMSLERLVASTADLVWASGAGFSCFLIRDSCIRKVGVFDETISPGYGYYEDCDYQQRIDGKGTRPAIIQCEDVEADVVHLHSQTLARATLSEQEEHHRRFSTAQQNYMAKWGLTSL